MGLFLNMPPNNTALTKTLETYLDSMGYKLANHTQDALRRRFGNALEWYTSMRHRTTEKIDGIISLARDLLPQNCAPPAPHAHSSARPTTNTFQTHGGSSLDPASTAPHSSPSASPSPSPSPSPPSSPTDSHPDYPFSEPEERSRPSDYLRARCPAFFGGKWEDPKMILAVIMSSDACFTQRRNKGKGWADPPTTVFVPEEVTKKMESFVDSVHPPLKPARNPRKAAQVVEEEEEDEDHIEDPQMPVPKSVLDDCQASFSAADEKRMKSSTQFFDDTGLMGLNG
ncbi:hypothetical protein B0H14DRAFT_3662493 [Mycena olivaceomarginata]|nr:hypothetical protein B0H14DRAFT_3662493 [Mycena olivaceomarginata]